MIAWLLPLLTSGIISRILNLGYEIALKLIGLIFYLASEYWGRWVLAAIVAAGLLSYGRWHYINVGREREASFRELVIDAEVKQRCEAKGGKLTAKSKLEDWLPEGWPK